MLLSRLRVIRNTLTAMRTKTYLEVFTKPSNSSNRYNNYRSNYSKPYKTSYYDERVKLLQKNSHR